MNRYPKPEPARAWAALLLRRRAAQCSEREMLGHACPECREDKHLANRISKYREKRADWPALLKALFEMSKREKEEIQFVEQKNVHLH